MEIPDSWVNALAVLAGRMALQQPTPFTVTLEQALVVALQHGLWNALDLNPVPAVMRDPWGNPVQVPLKLDINDYWPADKPVETPYGTVQIVTLLGEPGDVRVVDPGIRYRPQIR
ncbi:MAG: hypothetical protein KIT72_07520 [Polyangiaceae bacterium]|nr:hypothetical protein [Polyangiaceae bacterium]